MQWIIESNLPVHDQIVDELKTRIFLGLYRSGDKVPSVRDLALEAKVNPNTMQKALAEVESSGLINTRGTSGKYVANSKFLINQAKEEKQVELVEKFIYDLQKLEVDGDRIINHIKERLLNI